MKVKIALCQMRVTKYPEENRETLAKYMEEAAAAGCDFFVPPEMWSCSFDPKTMAAEREEADGPSYQLMKEAAAKYGMYIVGGSIPVINGDRLDNACFVFDREGNEIARYNKIHMFDLTTADGVEIKESARVVPGNDIVVFDTEFGKMGVAICFDLRFAGLFLKMAEQGAKVIFLPAEFTHETGKHHWVPLARARAIETGSLFVAVDAAYRDDLKVPSYGHSCVIDPWGAIIEEMDGEPGMVIVEAELDQVDQVRARMPVLDLQRHDLY